MSGPRSCNNGRRAFTLTECLVVLPLIAVILSLFFAPFKNAVYAYRLYSDRRIAESRIWTVGGILKNPVFYCALGIPVDAEEYKKSFASQNRAPFKWEGPISVAAEKNDIPNSSLRIAYAYPELSRTRRGYSAGKNAAPFRFNAIANRKYFDLDLFDKKWSVKNWVLFENAEPRRGALMVTKASAYELELKSFEDYETAVPEGDRLLLFRAIEFRVRGDKLYTNDFRTAGEQPRENGVCDIRFYLNDKKNLLTVYLIVRGDDTTLAPGTIVGAEKCPEEILSQWRGRSPYILYCAKFTWPILNSRN